MSQNYLLSGELVYTTYKVKDGTGRDEYIALASPGSSKASAVWQIKKLTYDAGGFITDISFANGDAGFRYIANDYAGYSYS